jgi:HK97 family phage major capsid protein
VDEKELREFLQKQDGELKALLSEGKSQLKVHDARLLALEQHVTAPGFGSSSSFGNGQSLGSLVTASEGYKAILKGGRSSGHIEVKTFSEKANVVTGTWSSAPLYLPTMHTPPPRRLRVRDLMPQIPVTQNLVEWPNEDSFTSGAGYQVNEADVKGESTAAFSLKQTPIVTIAHWLAVSKQVVDDSVAFENYINQRLIYKLAFFIEHELLYGVGGAGKVLGVVPQATAASGSPLNLIDGTANAIAQLANADVEASAIVCNSADWWGARAQKASTSGVYVAGDPLSAQTPVLWGLSVVPTPSMTQGQFLVGDFTGYCALFDRQAASLEVSREHSDFWVRNLLAVLCEERLALAVFYPGAFVVGTVHPGS